MTRTTLALCGLLGALGCSKPVDPPAPACPELMPATCTDGTLTYAEVAPIVEQRCGSCHNDQPGAPWPLNTWQTLTGWNTAVQDDLVNCTMPPADGGTGMTNEERAQLVHWLNCGAPR